MDLTTDYFTLFELPVDYRVDRQKLSERYRLLQQQYHPDRFASAPEQERRISLQMASRVNEGNRVLRDPIERARYLLEQSGVDLGAGRETLRDGAFLMEQMELREELESVQQEADAVAGLEQFVEQMEGRIGEQGDLFAACWQEDGVAAKHITQRMQFFHRLAHQAESMIDDLI